MSDQATTKSISEARAESFNAGYVAGLKAALDIVLPFINATMQIEPADRIAALIQLCN